ncbi:MAG: DUF1364 family protein [Thauera sp.]|nr:DUF1364 family protein [Thauera sp.]
MFPKPKKVRSGALRRSARGQNCTLRLPHVCNFDPRTTVLCHLPGHARGMGTKEADMHAVYGCSACHDVIDGRTRTNLGDALILEAMLRALSETQALMVEAGLITVKE